MSCDQWLRADGEYDLHVLLRDGGGAEAGQSVPIGRPIANTQVYVLDARQGASGNRSERGNSTSVGTGWRVDTATGRS